MFRHPNDLGGAYWLFSYAISLASLPLAASYYERNVREKAVADIAWVTDIAWSACLIFVPTILALKVFFFSIIKKEYRKTFWTLKRGKDVSIGHMESSEDSVRALIFIKNRRHWKSIEGKVEEWVRENWERWMEEKPEWLNDNMKARIPPNMIPNINDRQEVEVLQSVRRRSSLLGRLSARRRSSFIGAEKVTPD